MYAWWQVLRGVSDRFGIRLPSGSSKRIRFVHVRFTRLLRVEPWPTLTVIGNSKIPVRTCIIVCRFISNISLDSPLFRSVIGCCFGRNDRFCQRETEAHIRGYRWPGIPSYSAIYTSHSKSQAFIFPFVRLACGSDVRIAAYVHYPTMSYDMLARVTSGTAM